MRGVQVILFHCCAALTLTMSGGALVGFGRRLSNTGAAPRTADVELLEEKFELEHASGKMRGIVVRHAQGRRGPAVLVNTGSYSDIMQVLLKEAPSYAKRGYAYVLACNGGTREEIADHVFARWHADAAALLDWLGKQDWCDGRVGVHGLSLVGSTAFAAAWASLGDPDAPKTRARVCALTAGISFSRIQPTAYLFGHGLAIELILRFLWLAEIGANTNVLRGAAKLWSMVQFLAMKEFPGLLNAAERRPALGADVELWGRENALWRGGYSNRSALDDFWSTRDIVCDIPALGPRLPPVQIIAGWWDVFLRQGLEDYRMACEARGSDCVRLLVLAGGHFGTAGRNKDVGAATLAWYDSFLRDAGDDGQPAVKLEVIGAAREEYLYFDSWPPPDVETVEVFALAPGTPGRLGELSWDRPASAPPDEGPALQYVYDPRTPTPYAGEGWLCLRKDGSGEQRMVERRSDVMVLTSPPLEKELEVVGNVRASLYMSCSAPECDVVVRLCRVQPPGLRGRLHLASLFTGLGSGRSHNICESIVRFNFRDAVDAGGGARLVELEVGPTCCRFRAGDRLRVQICSAVHPRALRHPLQPDGEDWLGAVELGPPATLRLYADAARPSALQLPVLRQPSAPGGAP